MKYLLTIDKDIFEFYNTLDLKYAISKWFNDYKYRIYYELLNNKKYNYNGTLINLQILNDDEKEIKFHCNFYKLHNQTTARLLDVRTIEIDKNNINFIKYDTQNKYSYYLVYGTYILLTFIGNDNIPFTTLRRFSNDKIDYYYNNINNIFKIKIVEPDYSALVIDLTDIKTEYKDILGYNYKIDTYKNRNNFNITITYKDKVFTKTLLNADKYTKIYIVNSVNNVKIHYNIKELKQYGSMPIKMGN